jgi:hypothetical protein
VHRRRRRRAPSPFAPGAQIRCARPTAAWTISAALGLAVLSIFFLLKWNKTFDVGIVLLLAIVAVAVRTAAAAAAAHTQPLNRTLVISQGVLINFLAQHSVDVRLSLVRPGRNSSGAARQQPPRVRVQAVAFFAASVGALVMAALAWRADGWRLAPRVWITALVGERLPSCSRAVLSWAARAQGPPSCWSRLFWSASTWATPSRPGCAEPERAYAVPQLTAVVVVCRRCRRDGASRCLSDTW